MKQFPLLLLHGLVLTSLLAFSSCKSTDSTMTISGSRVELTAEWDNMPNEKATAIFAPYKAKVDSIMSPVIGTSAITMEAKRPESLLSNLIADVLRQSTVPYIGQPADLAVINVGGLRNALAAGDITYRTIYEILPFENSLCILSLRGKDVKNLMENIAEAEGEGVSNIHITMTPDKKVVDAKVGHSPIDDNRLYTVATVDYLAEGNDRMSSFRQAEKRQCIKDATIREIVVQYIKAEAAKGNALTSKMDNRIVIK